MSDEPTTTPPVSKWLRTVMAADRAGSAWYFGASFLFAPMLALVSPWPAATALLWWVIGLTGLYLGLLGIAMTIGLARVLRSGAEIPEDYWRSMIDHLCAEDPT